MDATPTDLGYLLHRASRVARGHLDERLAPLGITSAQAALLLDLSAHADPGQRTPARVSERLDIGRQTMTGLLERSRRDSLVSEAPNPADRRSVIVSVSPRGEALVPQVRAAAGEAAERTRRCLSHDEARLLAELLERLAADASGHEDAR